MAHGKGVWTICDPSCVTLVAWPYLVRALLAGPVYKNVQPYLRTIFGAKKRCAYRKLVDDDRSHFWQSCPNMVWLPCWSEDWPYYTACGRYAPAWQPNQKTVNQKKRRVDRPNNLSRQYCASAISRQTINLEMSTFLCSRAIVRT